jgi:hypothetical protein
MERARIFFKLEQDAEGYPPFAEESMWAKSVGNDTFELDNIPFYASEATLGDVVKVVRDDGILYFDSLVKESGNALVRIIFYHDDDVQKVRKELEELGCESELSHNPRYIAVNVPREVNYAIVRKVLDRGFNEDRWDYQEAILPS